MIVFPGMLLGPAEKAGIKTPADADNYDANEYTHFAVFCNLQLARPMSCHWTNAKIIATIPEDKIKTITVEEILEMGWQ